MRTIRRQEVRQLTGLSNSQIDRMEAAGRFPRRVRLSERTVAWVDEEVAEWVRAKIAERDITAPMGR